MPRKESAKAFEVVDLFTSTFTPSGRSSKIRFHAILSCLWVMVAVLPVITSGQQLVLSQSSIDFGNVDVGTTTKTETLTATGASLTVSAVSATGNGFSVSGISLPLTLGAGQSSSFTINFTPSTAGTFTGTIAVSTAAPTTTLTIALSGTVLPGDLLPGYASIGFGPLQVGTSRAVTETLTDSGGTSVTVSTAPSVTGGFAISGLRPPFTLNPGQRTSFKVIATSVSNGATNGTVEVTSNGFHQTLSIPVSYTGVDIKSLPECSLAKTNGDCKLRVDREKTLTPPTIQMYSNTKLTVIVTNPRTFERYFLDYQSGQATLTPDITSNIVQGLLPALGKIGEFYGFDLTTSQKITTDQCAVQGITGSAVPLAGTVKNLMPTILGCLAQLSTEATGIYRSLEPFVSPDSLVRDVSAANNGSDDQQNMDEIAARIKSFVAHETILSAKISDISNSTALKTAGADTRAIVELTDLQKLADAVANDLLAYRLRIKDLDDYDSWFDECGALIDFTKENKNETSRPANCFWITSKSDDDTVYDKMVTRTVTYSLNTLNLVSNSQESIPDPSKKKLLTSVTINFADTPNPKSGAFPLSALRWEASAGALFSTLPIRSFSVAPVFTDGVITNKTIARNVLHPTVVPFAAANYRLSDDLSWTRWKSNVYWTGAVGINPNTVSADFATGPSISWRALMVSFLAHFGHDVRLTQGLNVGQSLGASFNGSLPTHTYWTTSFAIGLSVRIPSLVGR